MAARQATPEEKEIAAQMEAALKLESETGGETPGPAPLELNPEVNEEPVRRRPGRPPGSGGKKTEDLLHQSIDGDSGPAKPGRKPGRPSKDSAKTSMDPGKLGAQLVGIHQLLAMFTQTPELQLSPEQGQALGAAVVNVCNEYDLNISGKTGAMVQLLATSAMIYAPMLMAVRFRYAQEELAREQAAKASTVATFPVGNYTGPVPTN